LKELNLDRVILESIILLAIKLEASILKEKILHKIRSRPGQVKCHVNYGHYATKKWLSKKDWKSLIMVVA